jgi:hypothetical protein
MQFNATGSITEDGSVGPLHQMVEDIDGKEVIKVMA